MRRNSPRTGRPSIVNDIFCERSPSATASSTRATSTVGRTRSSIIELTLSMLSRHEPFTPRRCARSVIRPSRPITLLTRPSSRVSASRLSASWLNTFATSPIAPDCSLSRTFNSPSLAWRSASTSAFRSCFETSTVPFWPARRAGLLLRVLVSGATATAGSFVRGITGPPVDRFGRRVSRLVKRVFAPGGQNLTRAREQDLNGGQGLLEIRPEFPDRLQADAQAQQARRDAVALPAGSRLEDRVDAAETRGVRDESDRCLDCPCRAGSGHVEGHQSAETGVADALDLRMLFEPSRELLGGFRLAPDANRERLQAAQQEPRGIGRRDDARARAELIEPLRVLGALADDGAEQHV